MHTPPQTMPYIIGGIGGISSAPEPAVLDKDDNTDQNITYSRMGDIVTWGEATVNIMLMDLHSNIRGHQWISMAYSPTPRARASH
ncbi:hypothetical protein AFLA_007990 [Aspergillus flavus NRRL3357]|nr:hypothetical protein AFLA_007990 [Aspergillus flavus NRRL3357]